MSHLVEDFSQPEDTGPEAPEQASAAAGRQEARADEEGMAGEGVPGEPGDPPATPGDAPPSPTPDFHEVVTGLCRPSGRLIGRVGSGPSRNPMPSREAVVAVVESLRSVLFPGYFGFSEYGGSNLPFPVGATLDRAMRLMHEQVSRSLRLQSTNGQDGGEEFEPRALEVTGAFLMRLPEIQRLLATDVEAAFDGDPAARSLDEVVYCYPGVFAVTNYRLAHELYKLGVPLIPRMITEHAHSITGIDIHPGATIGERFFIDHGTGVVIGETSVIGRGVRIYHGVTLGARAFPEDAEGRLVKGLPRHPIVEDEVVIYAFASILGRITIGRGSVIGGNVWLTASVEPNSRVTQVRPRAGQLATGETS